MKTKGTIFCPNCGRSEYVVAGHTPELFSEVGESLFNETNSKGDHCISHHFIYNCRFCDIPFNALYLAVVIPSGTKEVPLSSIEYSSVYGETFWYEGMVYVKLFSVDKTAWKVALPTEPTPVGVSGNMQLWGERMVRPCQIVTYGYCQKLASQ